MPQNWIPNILRAYKPEQNRPPASLDQIKSNHLFIIKLSAIGFLATHIADFQIYDGMVCNVCLDIILYVFS